MDTNTGDQFRARSWDEYIGQNALKQRLDVHINAAVKDNRYLDHTLLCAPPGSGKTTLARIIADRIGDPLLEIVMPLKPAVFAATLRQWPGGILFLDEIHRASKGQQEDLLSLLEDHSYQACRPAIEYNFLTVIAATTEPEGVIPALFDRFPIRPVFEEYSDAEMGLIVGGMAERLGLGLDQDTCESLARATGGIPRLGRQFALAARDIQRSGEMLTADAILGLCGYDDDGLDGYGVRYLNVLKSCGGQAGLPTIVSQLRLNQTVIRDMERLLVRLGYVSLERTGRVLTQSGWMRVRRGESYGRRVA